MATRDINHLIKRVVGRCGMSRPGEDVDEDAAVTIREQWEELHAKLVGLQVAYYTPDAIPLQVFADVVDYVALHIAPEFGVMPVLLNAIGANDPEAAKDTALRKMRDHVAKDFDEERMQVIPY